MAEGMCGCGDHFNDQHQPMECCGKCMGCCMCEFKTCRKCKKKIKRGIACTDCTSDAVFTAGMIGSFFE